MLKTVLFFASLVQSAYAQCQDVPSNGCSVCGDGKCVGAPDAIFTFPGQPSVPCGILEAAGYTGHIPLVECTFIPPLMGACECTPHGGSVQNAPTLAPPVSPAPVSSSPVINPTEVPATAPMATPTIQPIVVATQAPVTMPPTVPPANPLPTVVPVTVAPVTATSPPTGGKKSEGKKRKL